jgi:peptidoglycan/xylan/chitin deacetylase (PgdA/CDA1 family)
MHYVHRRFHVIPAEHIPVFLTGGHEAAKPVVAITFDDGYRDNFEYAFPVLQRLELPAMIFAIAGKVGQTNSLDGRDLPLADWHQLREMVDSGLVSVGSHSLSHPQFKKISPEKIQEEVEKSKGILEKKLRRQIHWFCYPKSQYTPQAIRALERAGYQYAFGGEGFASATSYSFLLPRVMVWGSPKTWQLEKALHDDQEWIRNRVRGWFHRHEYGPQLH